MKKFILLLLVLAGSAVHASTLTTENYIVTIENNCKKGSESCEDVTYVGKNKKSGEALTLKGETWHTMCNDGVTPCKLLGYQFENEDLHYLVFESGLLKVIQGGGQGTVLVEEKGKWSK